ncbi:MAG TPA: HAD-IA family hydrolase [Candidatus Dormibacteraeota bacterium]|nr:HAD-IA family hydrolase [Candidatus Dormibacteraeota bacterium]
MDEKGLGKRLQKARQVAGLTQQQLCSKANLSFSTLAKIERGAIKSPSIFTVQAIARALGSSLDALLGISSASLPQRIFHKTKGGASFIYFDLNGCLVRSYHRAFTNLAQLSSRPIDVVEGAFWHYNDAACRGTMSMSDFNLAIAERLGLKQIDWLNEYMSVIEPVPEAQKLLKWASERYKVGILTNIMAGQVQVMRDKKIIPNIVYDVIIDSSELGVIKPEQQIFEIAQEKAGCPPQEILLIDDTRSNLMTAEKMGWHVLWFDGYQPEESAEKLKQALEPA